MSTAFTVLGEDTMGALDLTAESHLVAAESGADLRTARKAIEQGVEVIRPLRLREAMRGPVSQARRRLGIVDA